MHQVDEILSIMLLDFNYLPHEHITSQCSKQSNLSAVT